MLNRELRVYYLADPTSLVSNSDLLAKVMLPGVAVDSNHSFSVSPASGYLKYTDSTQLWKDASDGALPPTADAAAQVGKHHMNRLAYDLRSNTILKQRRMPSIVPPYLQPQRPLAVVSSKFSGIDHWLCQFTTSLYTDRTPTRRVTVLGAAIDLRIGSQGRLIGLRWRWRPLDTRSPLLSPANPMPTDSVNQPPPQLVYSSADEWVSQTYLSPYYTNLGGDDISLLPACRHSLSAAVAQVAFGDGMLLTCAASGGSGDYQYDWAYWLPTDVSTGWISPSASEAKLDGRSYSQLSLPPGIYNVVIKILDRRTHVTTQIQRMVFTAGLNLAPTSPPLVA